MFFAKKKDVVKMERYLQDFFLTTKNEIKKRFETACQAQDQLDVTIKETQVLTAQLVIKLRDRIKSDLKNDIDSLNAICDSLSEGTLLVDGLGKIIGINGTGGKILGIKRAKVIGENLVTQVKLTNAIDYATKQPIDVIGLMNAEHSARIVKIVNKCEFRADHSVCSSTCKKLKNEGFYQNSEITVRALISCTKKLIKLNVIFLVLGCNAAEPKDVIYVMMFSKRTEDLRAASNILYAALSAEPRELLPSQTASS